MRTSERGYAVELVEGTERAAPLSFVFACFSPLPSRRRPFAERVHRRTSRCNLLHGFAGGTCTYTKFARPSLDGMREHRVSYLRPPLSRPQCPRKSSSILSALPGATTRIIDIVPIACAPRSFDPALPETPGDRRTRGAAGFSSDRRVTDSNREQKGRDNAITIGLTWVAVFPLRADRFVVLSLIFPRFVFRFETFHQPQTAFHSVAVSRY